MTFKNGNEFAWGAGLKQAPVLGFLQGWHKPEGIHLYRILISLGEHQEHGIRWMTAIEQDNTGKKMLGIIIHNMINKVQHCILVHHKVPSSASEHQEGLQLKFLLDSDPQLLQTSQLLQK